MKKFALIVAGGTGSRMGTSLPKQFIGLLGEPILMHTIRAFHCFDSWMKIIVVLPEDQKPRWEELCVQHRFSVPHQLVTGGSNRFGSVKNGLEAIGEDGIVFIHDGVRPLVSRDTLSRCLAGAEAHSNAIPVVPVTESLRKAGPGENSAVDRSMYFHVQTPQTFRVSVIKKAYLQEYDRQFTDDASVLERTGCPIHTVEGNFENIKITRPSDIVVAEAFMKRRNSEK
ncbi:MAG: 2-C-methyl-D-erythritol 4-phosphate cytidylyltransferase [Prolixibacteraceae bacterium]|nr:2-C-methyl-D-erythritol 4-phosphate cytidylyltransferase [Prolixibacteraceae bacterium]